MKRVIVNAVLTAFLLSASVLTPQAEKGCREFGFCTYDGKDYWYENWTRQGVMGDPKNITDTVYGHERGREIYDPETDAWYWLDAIYDGAKACDKEVWMPYIYQSDMDAGINKQGKWVRYNAEGKMIKGWYTPVGSDLTLYPSQQYSIYYYDLVTGEMVKGWQKIGGEDYHFDENTGVLDHIQDDISLDGTGAEEFLYIFLRSYSFVDYESIYSSSNPLINCTSIVFWLLRDYYPCVDFSVGPESYNYKRTIDDDFPFFDTHCYMVKFDANKVDWLVEHVLNLAQSDFDREFDKPMERQRYHRRGEGNSRAYYAWQHDATGGNPRWLLIIRSAARTGDICIVDYALYEKAYNPETDVTIPTNKIDEYRAVLLQKEYNGSPYWSIIASDKRIYE